MDETALMDTLAGLIETGTEEDVRAFILEHLPEFPEDVRAAFTLDILNNALDAEISGIQQIASIKEKAAKLIAFANGETDKL